MNLLLRLLPTSLPTFVREEILSELFTATAQAFGCERPELDGLNCAETLQVYAEFTRDRAEAALRSGDDLAAIEASLYANAYPLGRKLRRVLAVDEMDEVLALGQRLYGAIGVDFHGDQDGQVTVTDCYFRRYYSGPVCALISALDRGVFAGLSGGWQLEFSERLTEGASACRAWLRS